jgi:exonuclease SbcC
MLIRKLELKNFGIHRDLKFDAGGTPVVGLLGKNGAGKSTILNALRYAYTGELEDTIESMATYGQKKGYVKLEFEKDGKTGVLKREVGKAPKRELVWEGETLTSVKDVDTKISEILDVDRKAFSNACFLKQGSLNELLFGTESSREQLFIKLVNLSFFERYCSVIDAKIKTMLTGVEDFTSIKDELSSQKTTSIDNVSERSKILKDCKNPENTLLTLSEIQNISLAADELRRVRLSYQQTIHESNDHLNTVLAAYDVVSVNALDSFLEGKRVSEKELIEKRQKIVTDLNARRLYNNTVSEVESWSSKTAEQKELLVGFEIQLKELEIPEEKLRTQEELSERVHSLKVEIKQLSEWYDTRSSEVVTKAVFEDGVKCFACGQAMTEACSEENLKLLLEDFQNKSEEYVTKQSRLQDIEELINHNQMCDTGIRSAQAAARALFKSYTDSYKAAVEKLETLIDSAAISDDIEEEMQDVCKNYEDMVQEIGLLEKDVTSARGASTKLNLEEERINRNAQELEVAENMETGLKTRLQDGLKELGISESKSVSECKILLEALRNTREAEKGRLMQAEANLEDLTERLVRIEEGISNNEHSLKVVEELRELKDLLSRKGLPRHYILQRFKKLAILTAENLAILNSDFTVDASDDEFASFVFERFDGEEQVRLPMSKMSGGQKVRLCIAFLLAVQRELVTEVGFQTFDEPSTHLDEEGVDRLCHLFQQLQELLNTAEHQIWVCDHNPILEGSFNRTLKL